MSVEKFKVGDEVRVKPTVRTPKHLWGPYVNHQSVGVISSIDEERIQVDFPKHLGWNAAVGELEAVSVKKPPRKSPEKVLAYGVMKDGDLHRIVYDREVARSAKAKLGGKAAGATIVVLQPGKEIR